jgi:hypothetical protein
LILTIEGEGKMDKIYAAARALAVILAIVSAFVAVPNVVLALLVLGGVSALGNDSEQNSRTYLIAIVLTLGATTLEAIPAAGTHLATIFAGLGTAAMGASMVAIAMTLACRIKSDWVK